MSRITNLQRLLPSISETDNQLTISVYAGKLTTENWIDNVKRLKKTFPTLPEGFYDVLAERLTDNTFTDERFTDAVKNVIDTCVYPQPTIAQFISFDKRIKLYTYEQYVKLVDEGSNASSYQPVKLKDNPLPVWIHINDIKKYNIKDEQTK